MMRIVPSVRTVAILGLIVASCAAARANGLIPVHGYVLSTPRRGRVIMRLDRVVGMLPGGIYSVGDREKVPAPGTQVDALVVKRGNGLALAANAIPARAFVAGVPDATVKHFVAAGDPEPAYSLVDESGKTLRLGQFKGKTTILAFVFTRCTDICLTISTKFQQLQRLLDARNFHLVEVTIDPMYDSPAVLAKYGSKFGANPNMWSLATGESSVITKMMDSFGVSSLAAGNDDYLHDARVVLIDRHGVVRDVIESAGWFPANLAASARDLDGLPSNPLRRFWFATFEEVSAACGGNQSVAVIMILVVAIPLILLITMPVLFWFRRRIFSTSS
ncbi:MAG: SCO family protein [Vulcanimicrobiaceae bacterium]